MVRKAETSIASQMNKIRKLSSDRLSVENKDIILSALTRDEHGNRKPEYAKDENLSQKARERHRQKMQELQALRDKGVDEDTIEAKREELYPEYKNSKGISPDTWSSIQDFAKSHNNTVTGEYLEALKTIAYTREKNTHGIEIHTLGKTKVTSFESTEYPFGSFTYQDLNNNPDDYTAGRSLDNLQKNPQYMEMLTKSESLHASQAQANALYFSMMQRVADAFKKIDPKFDVTIDLAFIKNPSNDNLIIMINEGLRTLTGNNIAHVFDTTDDGDVSSLDCNHDNSGVYRDSGINVHDDFVLSSFSKFVGSSST